ncbi:unnamed protein product [Rotaria magnacalcarata]|uniref:Uncharacterized protein n=1 Tax=Rotaria magnacalcarata TaxID=392030 RepID=A0A815DSM7_9BILA|nr:unnamed protein product [Rotaria magnacalcarata]
MTFSKQGIAASLRNIDSWISIFKRVMIRVLSNVNVDTEVPLQYYLERKDLWTGNVTDVDITTFDLDDTILLYHTFVILRGLEKKRKPSPTDIDVEQEQNNQKKELKSVETSTAKVTPWMTSKGKNPSTQVKVIQTSGAKAKKRIA